MSISSLFLCFFFLVVPATGFLALSPCSRLSSTHHHANTRWTPPTLLQAELGELSISPPPRLDPELIAAAQEPLPWEEKPVHDNAWQNGQYWFQSRQLLVDLWVLPRDMSNGSWENYAIAAASGEQKLLQQVPQLLRLESSQVEEAARTLLKKLKLPPALLRKEPILLAMKAERLMGGFEQLQEIRAANNQGESSTREACRDTPGLLAAAATKWTEEGLDLAP